MERFAYHKVVLSCFLLTLTLLCYGQREKINGISFVGSPNPISESQLQPVLDLNANWVTFMPFAYGKSGSSHLTYKDVRWQWWGEGQEGVSECTKAAKAKGLKVMIKPHLWFDHGSYTGHFELNSDKEWKVFEASYSDYVLGHAKLAEENDADMFCIGVELTRFCEQRPEFWRNLIDEVRKVYNGKLTYAGNWDSYNRMPFWDKLDYIGVDAYFPLCDENTPRSEDAFAGWEPHFQAVKRLSKKHQKEVIFTEWGFRSTDQCCHRPWETGAGGDINLKAQKNAYMATFERFWNETWFAGGFVWKWFPNHPNSGGTTDNRFTPQNKPAEEVLREWFSRSGP